MQTESFQVFIGLGSNLGDGKNILLEAWKSIGEVEGVDCLKLSSPYQTAPVDMNSQHWFTNAVGHLAVNLTPLQLLERMMEVEASFGRKRKDSSFGYQDRTLDLDMLYFADVVMNSPELVLPHPRIGNRLFVLVPLVEIAPQLADPVSGRAVSQMEGELLNTMDKTARRKQEIIKGSWT